MSRAREIKNNHSQREWGQRVHVLLGGSWPTPSRYSKERGKWKLASRCRGFSAGYDQICRHWLPYGQICSCQLAFFRCGVFHGASELVCQLRCWQSRNSLLPSHSPGRGLVILVIIECEVICQMMDQIIIHLHIQQDVKKVQLVRAQDC